MADREYENDRYEVNLNRLMNIQKDFGWCLRSLAFYALAAAIDIFVYGGTVQVLVVLACLALIGIVLKLRSNPGRFEITRTTIEFQCRRALLTLFLRGRIYFGGENSPKYTINYTVCNIKSIEYLQSSFEKIFSSSLIE